MFHHLVMFRFKAETTQEDIDAVSAGLATLPDQIAEIVEYRFGPDVGTADGSWDFGLAAVFASEDDYRVYRDHPTHVAVITERIAPVKDKIERVQFTF